MRRLAVFLGTPVDDVTMSDAVDRIFEFIAVGRATGRVHQVATVNVDFVVQAAENDALLDVMQRVDLSIPDGMPLVWTSRLLGTPLRDRVAGADLVPALAREGRWTAPRWFCSGQRRVPPSVPRRYWRHVLPACGRSACRRRPSGPTDRWTRTRSRPIVEARADIVCVALGNPKQEFWIHRYAAAIGAPVFIGVGGTLDLLVGEKRRAPMWTQRAGLEWVFRAAQEPSRLVRRYAHDIVTFIPRLAKQAVAHRPVGPDRGTASWRGGTLVLAGRPRVRDVPELDAGTPQIVIDIGALSGPDNVSGATLAAIALDRQRIGGEAVLQHVTDAQRSSLAALRLDRLLGLAG